MTLAYRDARLEDARALARFGAEKFVEAYCDQSPLDILTILASQRFTPELLREEIEADDVRFFVAEEGETIVAYALVRYDSFPGCPLDARRPAEVQRIYVDPKWQGRGVARELIGRCVADARAVGCDVVWLAVWDSNPRAIRFYTKSGFAVVGEQPFVLGDEIQRDFVMAWPAAEK